MINFTNMSEKARIRKILQKKDVRIFFIGIGGISMSALALLLKSGGARVAGSDIRRSEITDMLVKHGIVVKLSHTREAIMAFSPDIVVFSLSISTENNEYKAATEMGIPTVSRAELLGAVMENYEMKIGVSGSHGKSTVTAMLGSVLEAAELEPSVLCGAEICDTFGLKIGKRDYLVYEACEYGNSFLEFSPDVQVLLNLELDHTDYFKSEEAIRESFLKSANTAKNSCVLNLDSENLALISKRIKVCVHTFSKENKAEYRYEASELEGGSYSFKLYKKNEFIGEYFPYLRGGFNLINAVATAVSSDVIKVPYEASKKAIESFSGIKRRLEIIKKYKGFDVFYDYAHHPSEIRAAKDALVDMGYQKIAVIFAPHTYSRTSAFLPQFADELAKFNTVYITDIYGAREKAIVGVNSSSLAEAVCSAGGIAHAVGRYEVNDVISRIKEARPDCVVLMGAGELNEYKEEFTKL